MADVARDPRVGMASLGRRRALYATTTLALVVIIGLAFLDGIGATSVYGPKTRVVTTTANGVRLDVDYPAVTRPGLASVFRIEIQRDAGFDAPVVVGVSSGFLAMWDTNALRPAPVAESVRGAWTVWEFDAPTDGSIEIVFDGRIEPAVQSGGPGAVALFDGDAIVAEVQFSTRVMG